MIPPAHDLANAPSRDWTRFALSLAFNTIPLAGVLFWGWSAFELIFLYWLENVVVGVRTFLTILLSGRFHGPAGAAGLSLFFAVHYGILCGVHGAFVVALFGGAAFGEAVDFARVLDDVRLGAIAIVLWQGALLALYIVSGDRSTPAGIMGSPYPRIVALHLTILAGGMLLMALSWPHAGIVVLAIIKTAMDAFIALRGQTVGKIPSKGAAPVSSPSAAPRP